MEKIICEFAVAHESGALSPQEGTLEGLNDLQLAMIAGGAGDTIWPS